MANNGIVFFGNERLASAVSETGIIFSSLLEAGFPITHLVINQAHVQSRHKHSDKVVELAQAHGIEIVTEWSVEAMTHLAEQSQAGILAAFGRIIPESVINAFPSGIINIHPSLLPFYRGTTPIESAILNGDAQTGVSIMKLAKGMDDGDVYWQGTIDLSGAESKQQLYETLSGLSAQKLVEVLPSILDGSLVPTQQNHETATFTKMIEKAHGTIDWHKSAEQIEREIRAYLGWPGSKTQIAGKDVTITSATVIHASGEVGQIVVQEKDLVIYCASHALIIRTLKPAGSAEMDSRAFLAGHQII